MLLKAKVMESTWVRISVDDRPPKEYIFSRDTKPEWGAKQGFDLLIGNAGGIVLEFNGEKIENLGDPGQVVRIRLPKGRERSVND
jgi:cytoskeleton protein RodZ